MIALALKGKKSTKKSILFFGSFLSLFWIYGFLGNTDLAKETFLAENPIYSAEARLATCTNNIPNNDGSIVLTSVTFGDRVNYSIGNTYTGDPDYNNAAVIGGIPFTIASGLPNPTVFTDYTVRVFNGDSGTFTDVVVRLYQKTCAVSCDCTDYLYVNDPTLDLTHKFTINPDGTIGAEIGSPWMPTGNITNPHGVVGDVNGKLYIAQIDVTPTQLYQVDCDGTILNTNAIPNWNRTLNLVSDDNTIYSIGRSPAGGTYHIYAHDVCSGTLINSIQLPGGTPGWGLTKGEDGELYFTMSFAGITSPHRLYHVDKNLTTTTLVWSIPQISGYNTHGVTQDEFGNFYIVLTRNSPGATTLYKINSAGTVINTISDNALDETGFGGTWGIVYNKFTGKLYMGTLGDDCVAVVDAGGQNGNMAYESTSGVGHVPGSYSKAINIVRECCPGAVNINLDTVICGVPFNTEIFLADIISCDEGVFCEGVWAADPGNGGITYDPCNQTISFNNASACGEFSLTSGGGGQCGTFNFNVNIAYGEVIAPVVDGDQLLCKGEDPAPFTVTTPGSGNNVLQYQWQRSFTDCNTGFSSIPGATSDTYDPPAGIDTTTYYRLITMVDATGCTSGTCLDTSNCITVLVREITDPGITGLTCNDNLTPTDGADDFIEFSLNPQGHNNGSTYSLSVNNGGTISLPGGFPATNISFGAATSFEMQSGSADGTVYDITITDDSNPGCPYVFQISQSACSNDNVDIALVKVESSTGPYLPGDDVSFDITVYNQGTLPVTNVVVEDYLPTGLIFNQGDNSNFTISGGEITSSIANLAAGANVTRTIVLQIDPTFTGNSITNNAEIASYTGFADEDSSPGNNSMSAPETGTDNEIDDEAPGTPGSADNPADEDDFDPATISVLQSFDLALVKTLIGTGPFSAGDNVSFEITVYNQGLITATNVQITDYIPSDMIFNQGDNPDFTASGANAVATIPSLAAGASTTLEITLQIDPTFTGTSIINNAEITSATGGTDEDSTPGNNSMSAPETGTDNDIDDEAPGTPGTADNPLDEDDFDPASVNVAQSFDLALQKVLVTPGTYLPGENLAFEITVYNQGTLEATSIEVTDYIPTGFIFNLADNSDFVPSGSNAIANIPSLLAGASVTLEIVLQIDPLYDGPSIINNAEITSATGGSDEDSTPGDNSGSSPELGTDNDVNDESTGGADNPLDEDDFDPAEVSIFIPSDYGDLPDTYQTSAAANGPNHTLSQTLYLGTYVDAENDGQPEAMAGRMMDGDDAGTAIFSYGSNMENDDEDGVSLLTPLVPGNTACMEVTTHYDDGGFGIKAYLTGWADWNGNGQFDSGEQLLFDQMIPSTTDAEVSPGDLTLPYCFEVPSSASFLDGNVFMRFRISTVQGLDFFGSAPDGEVEDYKFPLAKVGNYVWEDTNLDGIQNEAGTGINGVQVQLVWAGVDGDLNTAGDNLQYLVSTANMSGVPGAYMFSGLIEGTYEISVPTAPAGLVTTIIDEPTATDFTDSDDPSGVSFTITDVENLVLNENGVTDVPGASGFPDNQEDISFDFGYFGACSLQITNMVASDCSQNRFELQITVEYENLQGDIEVQVNGRPYQFSKSGVTGSQTFTIPKLTCGPNYTVNVYVESVNDPACNGGLFSSFTTPCPDNNCLPVDLIKN
ncbi:MAG: SdrD B-like domain-containing protein [Saprospiraceae bacterium]